MANEKQSVFVHIGSEYYTFTAAEKKLADYILSAQDCISRMSISQLASACSVADATVSRFCRRLGYKGYPDFKLAIANASIHRLEDNPLSGEITREDTLETISQKLLNASAMAMVQTREVLNLDAVAEAAAVLRESTSVLCMGQGGSMLMAEEAAHLFTTAFPGFFAVPDSHMQVIAAANLTEKDIILFFSYSGSTKELMDVLQIARQRHIRTILITRYPGSPGAGLADIVLQCGSTEGPLQLGSVAARIAQLYLIDVLFSEMCRRDLDTCRHRRELVADALSENHV